MVEKGPAQSRLMDGWCRTYVMWWPPEIYIMAATVMFVLRGASDIYCSPLYVVAPPYRVRERAAPNEDYWRRGSGEANEHGCSWEILGGDFYGFFL
jgi:hypothetical protein